MTVPMRLVVVAEHPARTVGFTRVATDIAGELDRRGVEVTYIGFFSDHAPDAEPLDYRLVAVRGPAEAAEVVAGLLMGHPEPVDVLFVGRVAEVLFFERRLRASPQLRRRVRLAFYDAPDYAPAPPGLLDVADHLDRLVPATVRAQQALSGLGIIESAIPHAVDLSTFAPLDPQRRDEVRRRIFGLVDGRTLVGTFSRNSENKRLDLAARVVAHVLHGSHVRCGRCSRTSVAPLGLDGRIGDRPGRCRRCGSDAVVPGRSRDLVWQLHTEDVDRSGLRVSGGWEIDTLVERFELSEALWWQRDLAVGQGIPVTELAERMAACDVHLLLSDCGGWELTMLETAACGVPNIVADAGAFGEYVAPFSEVVPVVDRHWSGHGHRGEADVGAAVDALLGLLDDPARRSRLAGAGRQTAARFSTSAVGDRWYDRLERWVAGGA